MPTFETPEPITVLIEVGLGDVRITAGERTDTVVDVRPTDESRAIDVKAAQQTRVEYVDGTLTVRTPRPIPLGLFRRTGSVGVTIELPAGSRVDGEASASDLRCSGRLGECRLRTAAGNIQLDRAGPVRLSAAAGHITVEHADGDADINTSSGRVRIGTVDGAAIVKNSNGGTEIGTVTGDVQVHSANGDIVVDHAPGGRIDAKTANGSIRVGEVIRGSVMLRTSMGDLSVGIGAGTAAWLDVHTTFGRVVNALDDTASGPGDGESVEVRARTSYGDITIDRA